jgi:hypothetical protein
MERVRVNDSVAVETLVIALAVASVLSAGIAGAVSSVVDRHEQGTIRAVAGVAGIAGGPGPAGPQGRIASNPVASCLLAGVPETLI